MTNLAERLWQTAHSLPPTLLAEVLDFAEFLRARQPATPESTPVAVLDLCGGLAHSATFAGAPADIQQRLRDEWN